MRSKNYFPHIGCIFIHIPKTAGTSVSKLLGDIDEVLETQGSKPRFALPSREHPKHTKAIVYKERLEENIWNNSFKFTVVRNPFDQMVSCYNWWTQKAVQFPKLRKPAELVKELGFKKFVFHELGTRYLNEILGNPEHWFLDRHCNDLVDFIVKFEELETLIARLSNYVSFPNDALLPKLNSTVRKPYQSYYDDETIERTAWRFRYMLYRFNYTF